MADRFRLLRKAVIVDKLGQIFSKPGEDKRKEKKVQYLQDKYGFSEEEAKKEYEERA